MNLVKLVLALALCVASFVAIPSVKADTYDDACNSECVGDNPSPQGWCNGYCNYSSGDGWYCTCAGRDDCPCLVDNPCGGKIIW